MPLLTPEQERRSFEHNFAQHWQKCAKPGDFDRPAEFWFSLRPDGEYEYQRIRDAFWGWRLARGNWVVDPKTLAARLGFDPPDA